MYAWLCGSASVSGPPVVSVERIRTGLMAESRRSVPRSAPGALLPVKTMIRLAGRSAARVARHQPAEAVACGWPAAWRPRPSRATVAGFSIRSAAGEVSRRQVVPWRGGEGWRWPPHGERPSGSGQYRGRADRRRPASCRCRLETKPPEGYPRSTWRLWIAQHSWPSPYGITA